jgi:hypothetical protein
LNIESLLQAISADLAQVNGVNSSQLGLEDTLNQTDYPVIRIVPVRLGQETNSSGSRELDVHIYFGDNIDNQTTLQQVYIANCQLERMIDDRMKNGQWLAMKKQTEMQYEEQPVQKLFRSSYSLYI